MTRSPLAALCGLMLTSSALLAAEAPKPICFSSGPIDNIAQAPIEDPARPGTGEPVPGIDFKLASRYFSVAMLNNSDQEVRFEVNFFQIDGPGTFEEPAGTWPKPKQLNFAGVRPSVLPGGSNLLNSDWSDDNEPVYGYEAQVRVTPVQAGGRPLLRRHILLNGYGRAGLATRIVPEHRLVNTEWTRITCPKTWLTPADAVAPNPASPHNDLYL